MKNYVSIDKRTKKQQKAYYAEARRTWGNVNPVTRVAKSSKEYNRKSHKAEDRRAIACY